MKRETAQKSARTGRFQEKVDKVDDSVSLEEVNDKKPLTLENLDLIEDLGEFLARDHGSREPVERRLSDDLAQYGRIWFAEEQEFDEYDPPSLPVDPPENAGELGFAVFDAARIAARADSGRCLFDESDDAPTIADLIDESLAELDLDSAIIAAEVASDGWSLTEARHRGRLYGLRQVLDEFEADEPVDDERGPPALRVEPAPVKNPAGDRIPNDLRDPGGFLGGLTAWILSQSFKPQFELALGASIAILAFLTGRRLKNSQGTRSNLYVVAVAPSGAGKESPRACIKKLLAAIGLGGSVSEGAVSGQGLLSAVRASPSHLTVWDEFGLVLQAIGDKNAGPHLKSIISNLLRLFSSSNGVFAGEARADMKHESAESIVEPHEVLYGSTTPETFYPALDEGAVTSGFLGRFLFLIGEDRYVEPNFDLQEAPPPKDIIDEAAYWANYVPGGGDLKSISPQPRTVGMTYDASGLYRDWYRRRDREASELDGWRRTLLVRAGELASKLIMLHAVSLDRESRAAGVESVTWGTRLTDFLLGRLASIAAAKIASNPYERTQNELVEFIVSKGSLGATSNDLAQRFKKIKAKDRKEALEHAKEAGRITEEIRPSRAGRPAVVYLAASG